MAKKILVVDDDLYIRELYEEVLKNAGYDVQTAMDGVDGIAKLKTGGFDLVFLDMMMPKIDGLGVLTELSQNPPALKNGPIIILSNLDNMSAVDKAKTVGATSYLIKADITPDQLLDSAKKILGNEV